MTLTIFTRYHQQLLGAVRILAGFFFFLHGAQKILGWFTDQEPAALLTLIGLAGLIELVAGALLFLGLFTQPVAFISAVEMLVAYFKAHAPQGWNPLVNKGELALMYFIVFIILMSTNSTAWSLDKLLRKK